MEIHPPTNPITTVREFLVHLSMVTLGILIAIGPEQSGARSPIQVAEGLSDN